MAKTLMDALRQRDKALEKKAVKKPSLKPKKDKKPPPAKKPQPKLLSSSFNIFIHFHFMFQNNDVKFILLLWNSLLTRGFL